MKPGTTVSEAREAIRSFLESIGLGHPDFEVRNGTGHQQPLSDEDLIFETTFCTWPVAELCVDLLSEVPEKPIVSGEPPHMSFFRLGPNGASTTSEPAAPTSLKECFNLYCEEEVLTGDEAWACPRCKTKREAKKWLRLHDYPPVLVLHLKRFKQTMLGRMKDSRLVHFPRGDTVLDLDPWIAKDAPRHEEPGNRPVYKLFAGVYHTGALFAGHYTAVAEVSPELNREPVGSGSVSGHQEGKWCEFNDAKVTRLNDAPAPEQGAYILFYRRDNYVDSIIEDELRTDISEHGDIGPETDNPYAGH
jgi:hypothetical protein